MSGCYLTYEEASNGSLFLNWSKTPVAGALAYIKPSKTVPAFKFTTQGGKDELTRKTDNTAKNGFEGWCNFLKMANEYKGEFTLLTDSVTVIVHDGENLDTKTVGAPFTLHTITDVAVCVYKSGDESGFGDAATTGRSYFLNTAQKAGSALVLPTK